MAKPTTVIKGFIELNLDGKKTLLSINNILAIQMHSSSRAAIIYKNVIDDYNTKREIVSESYEEILTLVRQAQ